VTVDEVLARLRDELALVPGLRFAMLFGSACTRGVEVAADLDVAISLATPLGLLERARLATSLETKLGMEVDLVELDEASTLLRWEVVKHGRTIVANDARALLDFQARVPIEWADLEPYFARESEGLRRALEETRWSRSSSFATRSAG
jgi:predicted nucleotidyltransferase